MPSLLPPLLLRKQKQRQRQREKEVQERGGGSWLVEGGGHRWGGCGNGLSTWLATKITSRREFGFMKKLFSGV